MSHFFKHLLVEDSRVSSLALVDLDLKSPSITPQKSKGYIKTQYNIIHRNLLVISVLARRGYRFPCSLRVRSNVALQYFVLYSAVTNNCNEFKPTEPTFELCLHRREHLRKCTEWMEVLEMLSCSDETVCSVCKLP